MLYHGTSIYSCIAGMVHVRLNTTNIVMLTFVAYIHVVIRERLIESCLILKLGSCLTA